MQEWNEGAINQLIKNQVQENLHLDYKKSDSLVNNEHNKVELSKDVSAFANSDGGTIVYGVIEKNHIPLEIDGGIEAEGKREWIEQILNSKIYPRIPNIKIFPVNLKDKPRHNLFVIEIPVSTTAHQASDLKYYRRFNFQSIPMYDYEIKLVMNRFKEPNLEISFDLSQINDATATLLVFLKNVGKVTPSGAHIKLLIPSQLFDGTEGSEWHIAGSAFYGDEPVEVLYFNWGGPQRMPFLPELKFCLSGGPDPNKIRIKTPRQLNGLKRNLYYEIYADNMEPKEGSSVLSIDLLGRPSIQPGSG